MAKKIVFFLLLLPLILTGQSCKFGLGNSAKQKVASDAGIFKSIDGGKQWKQITAIPTISGKPQSIGAISVITMEVDPQDSNAIYLGTEKNGIYYTHDAGINWFKIKSFPSAKVYAIEVDPDSKCIIYASLNNTIMKTTDCGRSWDTKFVENNPKVIIRTLSVDSYNTDIVYAGTYNGVIYKSFDAGSTWSTPFSKVSGNIVKFLINPQDTRIIYLATVKNGIFKSVDGGVNWKNLSEGLKKYKGYNGYRNLLLNPSKKDSLILASTYGILKTEDGGASWSSIPLLTNPGQADIKAIAVDPKDDSNIFYATKNILYRTFNNGSDWETRKLFSTKTATNMMFNPDNPLIIYMTFSYPK